MSRYSLANSFSVLDVNDADGTDREVGRKSVAAKKHVTKAKKKEAVAAAAECEDRAEDAHATPASDELELGLRERDAGCTEALTQPLVWIDCEMTGLEVDTCHLIEIAVVVTDGQLSRTAHGPDIVIHQSEEVLAGMNEWCVEQHGKSGLTERVRASTTSLAEAESAVLAFVALHADAGSATLAGNSVHCDLAFLKRHMPRLAAHLHYRIVDVSSVRELAKRWFPSASKRAPRKACLHTARSDILER
jgi:oligoribonuclease